MFEKQPWMQRAGEFPQTDQEYFALLARAVFSAGLGPKVVESRWKEMGEAFHGFDPAQVTLMGEQDVARLLGDPGVIRNRRKIEAVIRGFESAGASPFPFVGVADPFAHGPAEERGFTGPDPDNRIGTGDIGKLELIDTGRRIRGSLF